MNNGGFETIDDWYAALVVVARSNNNGSAVRDFDGWTSLWEEESPADAYYEEFPEHISDGVQK